MRSGPPPASLAFTLGILLLATACTRGPQPPDLATLGALDPAVRALLDEQVGRRARRARPSPIAGARLGDGARGQRAHRAGARRLPPRPRRCENQHGRWWYQLALLAQRDGDTDAALQAFDRAIALSPDYVPARWRRGLLLLDRGDLDGAEAAFKVAANLAPNDSAGGHRAGPRAAGPRPARAGGGQRSKR